jgi:hypothetical protein
MYTNDALHSIVHTFNYDLSLPEDSAKTVEYLKNTLIESKNVISYCWDKTSEKIYDNIDTLYVFIFHPDTIAKYTWKEIADKYRILQRYDMTLNDLKNIHYHICYPPDKRMKDIKMYPPYEKNE